MRVNVEAWLVAVEGGMQQSLRKLLRSIARALPSQVPQLICRGRKRTCVGHGSFLRAACQCMVPRSHSQSLIPAVLCSKLQP